MENEKRRSVVASARTVQDAIASGLGMLGVRRDQVDVEVLNEGSRGVLGFGAENAQVRLVVIPPQAPPPAPPTPKFAPAPQPEPRPTPPTEGKVIERGPSDIAAPPLPTADEAPSPEGVGVEVLSELLRLMGVEAAVGSRLGDELAEENQAPPPVLNITGEDLGILIGRRGETLRALQYLVRLMVSHRLKHWTNLVVDVENYRVRRLNALENMAARVADQVVRTGRTQALEPMPPYERRLVHIALRRDPRVTTHSVGEGEKRKVTIVARQ